MNINQPTIKIAAVFGLTGVLAGAFGAHALAPDADAHCDAAVLYGLWPEAKTRPCDQQVHAGDPRGRTDHDVWRWVDEPGLHVCR